MPPRRRDCKSNVSGLTALNPCNVCFLLDCQGAGLPPRRRTRCSTAGERRVVEWTLLSVLPVVAGGRLCRAAALELGLLLTHAGCHAGGRPFCLNLNAQSATFRHSLSEDTLLQVLQGAGGANAATHIT
jgi:hypothetical protein